MSTEEGEKMLKCIRRPLRSAVGGLREILDRATSWQTIDDVVSMLDDVGFWDDGFARNAVSNAKKAYIRNLIRTLKDRDGFPLFPSVRMVDEDGNKRRVYKQETLFDVDDYRTMVDYHANLSNHHRQMAEGYVERCEKRHLVQLSLWDLRKEADIEVDDEWTASSANSPGKPR